MEAGVNTNCNICVHKAPIYVHIQVFGTIYRIIKDSVESNNLYILKDFFHFLDECLWIINARRSSHNEYDKHVNKLGWSLENFVHHIS